MCNNLVYLAGPMGGLSMKKANGWRDLAEWYLGENGIDTYNPVAKLKEWPGVKDKIKVSYESQGFRNKEVVTSDLFWIDRSDIILSDLTGYGAMSFGTPFEFGYSYAKGKPIVTVCDEELACHPFVSEMSIVYVDLYDALDFICSLM